MYCGENFLNSRQQQNRKCKNEEKLFFLIKIFVLLSCVRRKKQDDGAVIGASPPHVDIPVPAEDRTGTKKKVRLSVVLLLKITSSRCYRGLTSTRALRWGSQAFPGPVASPKNKLCPPTNVNYPFSALDKDYG